MTMVPPRVVVVGGGIAGLAAARAVHTQAPDAEVIVLEARDRTGGHIRTERSDRRGREGPGVSGGGGGPAGFLDGAPATPAFVEEIGLTPHLLPSRDAAR